jgi:methionine biosynthesis protein MetW
MISSPDDHSTGFVDHAPGALRYERLSLDPDDVGLQLARLIAPHCRVLDVGCGTGVITEVIQRRRSASIVGIEPDSARVQRALARGLDVHAGFLTEEFVRRHGPFDYIVFADVLEHLANPAEVVAIARQGLKAGGSIVASVPNVAHWFVRTGLLCGHFDYQESGIMDATHLRWFTRRTLREFFERLGFEITAVSQTVNVGLPDYQQRLPWRWIRPGLRRRLVGWLAAARPGLFGCQHVVRATLKR